MDVGYTPLLVEVYLGKGQLEKNIQKRERILVVKKKN